MPSSPPSPRTWVLLALLVAGSMLPARPIVAQEVPLFSDSPVSILLSAARAEYDRDFFCVDPDDWLTTFRLSVERGAFGVSVASVAAYPWPIPPPLLEGSAFIDRGTAYQVGVQVDPLRLLTSATGGVTRFVRPFVGGGVHLSTDGEPAAAGVNGDEPTAAIQGGTDAFVTYGARVTVPVGDSRLGLFGEVRGTSVFDGGKTFVDEVGERLESDSRTLTWAEFSVGVRLSLR